MEGPCLILPGRKRLYQGDDLGSDRARARFSGGRAATGGSERGSRRARNRAVQDRRNVSPQDWVPRRRASRDASGAAPRHRPLLAGDQLLNPVIDRDRRLPLRLVVVVAQAGGDQRRRRLSPGRLSVSRTRSRRITMSVTAGRRLGMLAACPAGGAASIRCPQSWAMSSRPRPDPRPGCRSCHASTGTLTRCLPARQENVLPALLCATMWITCAKRSRACARIGEMLGIALPGPRL
jgi:hypothetical protein